MKLLFFSIGVGVVGVVIVIVASVLGFKVLPDYIDDKIEGEVQLQPGSDTWEKWANITKPLHSSYYIFNVTNAATLLQDGYPRFQQLGPYSYRQRREKTELRVSEDKGSVYYETETFYTYDEEASGGRSKNELVTVLNIPLYLSFVVLIGSGNVDAVLRFGRELNGIEFATRKTTVDDLLFGGMDVSAITDLLRQNFPTFPVQLLFPNDKFGIFYSPTGKYPDGSYEIRTGVGDSSRFGEIVRRNGNETLSFWNEEFPLGECNTIKGSDGTLFPPFVEKDRVVHIFSSEICRSIHLTFDSETKVKGIKGYKFTLPQEALADPKVKAENRCYCNRNEDQTEQCLGAGVIDISSCKSNMPFVMSTPYFLDGEVVYQNLSGLTPNRQRHETALVLEPNSGVLLKANKRLQLNINFFAGEPVFQLTPQFVGAKSLVFPIFWVDENTEFTNENAEELKDKLLNPKKAVETWRWVVLGVGILLAVGGPALYVIMG